MKTTTVLDSLKNDITLASAAKVPNVICFRATAAACRMAKAWRTALSGLNKIKSYAEEKGVTVNLELLNSKVNHKDYMADHSAWGVELMKRVNSPRIRLLYDIYHMQIMEGDLIRTITREHRLHRTFPYGRKSGRHEIDDAQEVNWHAVAKAIADTGYRGFLSHEFVPAKTPPIAGLEEAYCICKV